MQFANLRIENWRQFKSIDIAFHKRLTIVTGTNGAGKTTILNTLSRALGWQIHMLFSNYEDREIRKNWHGDGESEFDFSVEPAGHISFDDGTVMDLNIPRSGAVLQTFGALRGADGVYITSHRPFFSYSPVNDIPTQVGDAHRILNEYTNRSKRIFQPVQTQEVIKASQNPSHKLKETLIAAATFGEGNSTVAPDESLKEIFDGFGEIMRFLLPDEIGFQRLMVRIPEIYVVSKSGVFPLESTSGGMSAIIDLAWQIFLASKAFHNFVVLIDEPENHLHPALQKRLLNDLVRAFPKVQFIVATHSPLMITSVEDSVVYALRPNEDRTISGQEIDFFNKSASATETLDRVLGVDGSTPQWASRKLNEIVERYLPRLDEPNVLQEMKNVLIEEGLSGDFTKVISKLSERKE
ncbi:AAA family ATPase [Aurantiacibacter sp. D1-12]|uniref:AAA family ATPase n=1 Tax=Aurantiacibacter sp. D1-12 TaxID=2993658 RepID=UPI00237CCF01|nr:AAA family ATPase [Aurantiacibacter sp. D1-12]MDE1468456.1 AAA family ATPase [Aurantiacibacter sp. D1-12]